MYSVKDIQSTPQAVSPNQARLWLESCNYERNRGVRSRWVTHLAREMESGRFTVNNIVFGLLNGDTYLVNGQHTLAAIIQANKSVSLPIIRIRLNDEDQLNSLYYHYDINLSRSLGDAIKAIGLPEITGLNSTLLKSIASAARWLASDFGVRTSRIPIGDAVRNIPEWVLEFEMLWQAISPCEGRIRNIIKRQPVLSVALITFRYAESDAVDFWRQVAQDDGMPRGDVRKALHYWLVMTYTKDNFSRQRVGGPKFVYQDISRACIVAWNRRLQGKDTMSITDKMIRSVDVARPKIDHTPFNGVKKTSDLISFQTNLDGQHLDVARLI